MRLLSLLLITLLLTTLAFAAETPLKDLRLAASSGFTATASGTTVTFAKTGDERRLLALAGTPSADATGAKALEFSYQLDLQSGAPPRLAAVVYEKSGGSWYKLSGIPAVTGQPASARLSVAAMIQTAFSADATNAVEWPDVDRVWFGFVFDGSAKGKVTVSNARFTDTTAVPTQPLRLFGDTPGKWSEGHDPAIKTTLAIVNEGPDGKPCSKFEFDVPAGSHMYAIPTAPITVEDLEGYKSLRFKLRGEIPQGMRLLITLAEAGGPAYFVEMPGPGPAEWTELTFPLSDFKWASWSAKDENNQFDLAKLMSVSVGSHGVPANARLGHLMVCDVELVP